MEIHTGYNWSGMELRDADGRYSLALMCSEAPRDARNQPYPPIEWDVICRAYSTARRIMQNRIHFTCGLPQVWTDTYHDTMRVVGTVWEICAKYQWGEFTGEPDVEALVCSVHQHLGPHYQDFVKI